MYEFPKSKMKQIESTAESILSYFGAKDIQLQKELEKLVLLIKEERSSKEKISEVLQQIANRV